MATSPTIDHVTLTRLVEAGAVRGAHIVGQPGGWGVVIQYGMTERVLAAKRGTVRQFRKFETLVAYLRDIGISRFDVDATQYDPAPTPARTRTDAAERLRQAHEAADHDRWFRAQVQAALDDSRPGIPHDDVMAELKATLDRLADSRRAD
ncbi:hypothetical protein [Methylocaldum sp.]|jgi:hypothetical protein|uniref:type II toxin-antitoxin system RelB family antitoxin n=1 Tax=Methylocaldum sp. TaxID=1969727 RepID=UPI00321FECD1